MGGSAAPGTRATPEQMEMLSKPGLDFLRAIIDGQIIRPPMSKTLNFHLTQASDGRVVFEGVPLIEHSNPMNAIHGGWYGTLLDSAMGCAVMSKLPTGSRYTTLEYKVNIIRAVAIGTEVEAIGIIHHFGRSTSVADGEIRGKEDGRLYATGSTTCLIMKA